jgi:hypothetical protein
MEPRWKHTRPDARLEGKKAKPNASHSAQGLDVKETFSTSGRGRKMFLTSPLIDQAFSQAAPFLRLKPRSMSVIAILQQRSSFVEIPICIA